MTRLALALLLLTCSATPSWAAGLTLSVRDGLVSLDAQDVTVRQILTEWARVGKTRIVNVERITGGPITLKLDAVPEKQALDIILRSIPGYMAMPRPTQVADASLYDRILIMPTTTAVAALRPQQPGPDLHRACKVAKAGTLRSCDRRSRRPYHRACCSIRRIQLIRWMTRRWLLPPLPASFPCLRSTRDPRRRRLPPTHPGPAPQPAQTAPGAGVPTNPWNAPIGTPQPSLAPPAPVEQAPTGRGVRPPQPDR